MLPSSTQAGPRRIASTFWDEFVSARRYLDATAFSEILVALVSLAAGAWILVDPVCAMHSPAIALMIWRYPPDLIAGMFLLAGVLTASGVIVSLQRGRCVIARLLRQTGSLFGMPLWVFALMTLTVWAPRQWGLHLDILYVGMCSAFTVTYLRLFFVSWRRRV